ncbi:coiled-coil domain-containing protein 42 homolog [Chanos chanos]|uniref:Coiled-coil domain-containing protein 42 homolog n=1 Tax=Chanos chanos TaxID=29144 RepID=A0A6J2WV54_CHACN|nr:coiled-coil domain-containing protein 42 homolog [Chanos chanos]
MALHSQDYFQTAFKEQLIPNFPLPPLDLRTNSTKLLEKRREIQNMDSLLKTRREEFQVKQNSLRHKREELQKKEEKLKDCLIKFDKFLKENDAKRVRGLQKAQTERVLVRQKEMELQQLHRDAALLQEQREKLQATVSRLAVYRHFLEEVVKMSGKFEDVGHLMRRFDTLLSNREELVERQSEAEKERESRSLDLRRSVTEQSSALVHLNNRLSRLQTELDHAHAQALQWETTWNRIQATAAKETLLLGQVKMVTLNLYRMSGGVTEGKDGVGLEDTEAQLERIRLFIQDRTEIVTGQKSEKGPRSVHDRRERRTGPKQL